MSVAKRLSGVASTPVLVAAGDVGAVVCVYVAVDAQVVVASEKAPAPFVDFAATFAVDAVAVPACVMRFVDESFGVLPHDPA